MSLLEIFILLSCVSFHLASPQEEDKPIPLLWTDVKVEVFEESTPTEYFPADEDFIVVEKDAEAKLLANTN